MRQQAKVVSRYPQRIASAKDGKKEGDRSGVGLFIPLPPNLAAQFPSLKPDDNSPTHTTFLYLGEVAEEEEKRLLEVLQDVVTSSRWSGVRGKLHQLDHFQHPDKERSVAHMSVTFNHSLGELRTRLMSALDDAGLPCGDSFPVYRPHVTLGYMPGLDTKWEGQVPQGQWDFAEVEVWGLPKVHTLKFGQAKTAARPIPVDKELIKTFVDDFYTDVHRFMKSQKKPDAPLMEQMSNMKHLFRVGQSRQMRTKDVRGNDITVPVMVDGVKPKFKNLSRLFITGGSVTSQGQEGKWGHPWKLYIKIDGSVPPEAWLDRLNKKTIYRELFSILIHEVTHLRDMLPTVGPVEHEDADAAAKDYYNRPHEVRAFMQQIADEVETEMEKIAKDTEGWGLDTSWDFIEDRLYNSKTWNRMKTFLEPKNKKLLLKATARVVTDAHPKLKKKYFVPFDDKMAAKVASWHLAKIMPLDLAQIERLRKDFLMLMKNTKVVKDYDQAWRWREAVHVWRDNFDTYVLDRARKAIKNLRFQERITKSDADYWNKKIGKDVWMLYLDATVPLEPLPRLRQRWSGRSDEELKRGGFADMQRELPKWDAKLRRAARQAWKGLKEFEYWYKERLGGALEVDMPVDERVNMEGFQVLVRGFPVRSNENAKAMYQDFMERFKVGLKQYKQRAQKVLPLLIRAQLPLVLDFNMDRDTGGTYEGRHISINPVSGQKNPGAMIRILAHEMGHHLYQNFLSKADQDFWGRAITGNYGKLNLHDVLKKYGSEKSFYQNEKIKRQDPILYLQLDGLHSLQERSRAFDNMLRMEDLREYLAGGGQAVWTVHGKPISGYAHKNNEEAFCEALGHLVGYGPRAVLPEVRSWLQTILPQIKVAKGLSQKVASRWLGGNE